MQSDVEIIAELAQGYEGNTKLSELLTIGAMASAADAIKYQLVYADELATPDYEYYELFESLEMDIGAWIKLRNLIHSNGQKMYFDIFGLASLSIANEIGADGVKLSTTEFYNDDLMQASLASFERVYISVGGIPIEDVDLLVRTRLQKHQEKCCLMYGFQAEPTPLDQNNLLKLTSLRERYPDYRLGFMDHSDGGSDDAYYLSLVALGMGISAIEKHLTLDRVLKIEDFVSGIAPEAFRKFVALIRKYHQSLGVSSLELTDLENRYREKALKVVVALRDLKKGDVIRRGDIALKRCGKAGAGETNRSIADVLARALKVDISKHQPILKVHI